MSIKKLETAYDLATGSTVSVQPWFTEEGWGDAVKSIHNDNDLLANCFHSNTAEFIVLSHNMIPILLAAAEGLRTARNLVADTMDDHIYDEASGDVVPDDCKFAKFLRDADKVLEELFPESASAYRRTEVDHAGVQESPSYTVDVNLVQAGDEYIDVDVYIKTPSSAEWLFRVYKENSTVQLINAKPRFSPDGDASFEDATETPPKEVVFTLQEAMPRVHVLIRKTEIEIALKVLGYQMQHSLAAFDGSGHAIIDLATGEAVDPPSDAVRELAEEWSLIEGVEE